MKEATDLAPWAACAGRGGEREMSFAQWRLRLAVCKSFQQLSLCSFISTEFLLLALSGAACVSAYFVVFYP